MERKDPASPTNKANTSSTYEIMQDDTCDASQVSSSGLLYPRRTKSELLVAQQALGVVGASCSSQLLGDWRHSPDQQKRPCQLSKNSFYSPEVDGRFLDRECHCATSCVYMPVSQAIEFLGRGFPCRAASLSSVGGAQVVGAGLGSRRKS